MQEVFEKIKEKIRKEIEDVIVKDTYTKGKNAGLRKAEVFVDEVAAEYNNGWIPCGEQQPEESGTYNITAFDGGKYRTTNAMWQKRSESWNLKGQRAYWSVIAWQPLPAPYQPKGE